MKEKEERERRRRREKERERSEWRRGTKPTFGDDARDDVGAERLQRQVVQVRSGEHPRSHFAGSSGGERGVSEIATDDVEKPRNIRGLVYRRATGRMGGGGSGCGGGGGWRDNGREERRDRDKGLGRCHRCHAR